MKKRLVLAVALLLVGCAGQNAVRSYDLGYDYPKQSLPPLRAVSVKALAPFEGREMHFRLASRNAAASGVFAQSRWAAPPADLVRRKILRATPSGAIAKCTLEAELHDFTQVFHGDASEARMVLRAALVEAGNGRVATRAVEIAEPDAGVDAAGGAAALARATERAVAELAAWARAEPACR